jgi:thiamine-monophosphate kinase
VDEFEAIATLFRPLTGGAPEAADLLDDAAFLPARPGQELVVTKDAVVEGVHLLPDDPPDLVARKLLRVNLSDLAAKAAEPFGYLLAVAWPRRWGDADRAAFARGLAEDQARYGVRLLGGDTVATPGPFTASVTAFGYAPEGRAVRRSGARAGDGVYVTGTIGDGWLGLQAARGELAALGPGPAAALAERYRLPQPRLELREALRAGATACADVSDGLVADLGHVARASGLAAAVDLARLPLSEGARLWLERQPDRVAALVRLAAGGDDYELVFTAPAPLGEAAVALTRIGEMVLGQGVRVSVDGLPAVVPDGGWRHA